MDRASHPYESPSIALIARQQLGEAFTGITTDDSTDTCTLPGVQVSGLKTLIEATKHLTENKPTGFSDVVAAAATCQGHRRRSVLDVVADRPLTGNVTGLV